MSEPKNDPLIIVLGKGNPMYYIESPDPVDAATFTGEPRDATQYETYTAAREA